MTIPANGLFVAPCSREAALWAVRAWHYLRSMASGRCLYFGVWFDGTFDGCAVVSRGSCANIGRPFDLPQSRIAEVTRIALRPGHVAPVSRVLAIVVRLLRRSNPCLELLVSFSDQRQGHHGGVYQGAGWTYLGETHREAILWLHGREVHPRTISSKYGTRDLRWLREHVDANARRVDCPPKHKYALGLTPAMRERLALLAQPYPKALVERGRSVDSARAGRTLGVFTPSTPAGGTTREEAGAIPDPAAPILHEATHV